jgi:hypothetical protein
MPICPEITKLFHVKQFDRGDVRPQQIATSKLILPREKPEIGIRRRFE